MIAVPDAFSTTYQTARAKFLQGAASAGMALHSRRHPLLGADGEDLALDIALDGDLNSDKLLIVSSACHGVEGYCGSGVQVFALSDAEWRERMRERGVLVAYLHALNPHGFSHKRRVTHENVDLNRNFSDYGQPLPTNEAYGRVHDLVLPSVWPPTAENQADIQQFVAHHGLPALQAAVTGGQHTHADGLFFGGTAPTWSHEQVRGCLRAWGTGKRRLGWIDLHTGLGPSGHGERIHAASEPDATGLTRARAWWGGNGATPITTTFDGSSSSAPLSGIMSQSAIQECPGTEVTAMALEFGTVPVMAVLQALRGDHWAHRERMNGRLVDPALQASITQTMLDAFYTQTDVWKGQIISQARQALFQAADGLAV